MAELLVRVRDKVSPDPYLNVRLTKRGDVIVVMPDGHDWAADELRNRDWRIVKVPGLSMVEAEAMTVEEPHDPERSRMMLRRWFRLDVDSVDLPQRARQVIADDSRAAPTFDLTLQQLRAAKLQKSPVADPAVIGPVRANVIG